MWIRFYCITFSIDNSTAGFILPKRHPHKLFIPLTDAPTKRYVVQFIRHSSNILPQQRNVF
jgi:hypothetical protein